MITRLQLNPSVNFKGENLSPALKARLEKQTTMPNNQQQGISGKIHNAKKGVLNVFKSVNNIQRHGAQHKGKQRNDAHNSRKRF